jgi:sialic acid synthase SpsE/quercetin dioxygenase-like cupin family protein
MKAIPVPLFVFEMANNHMGRLDHGMRIIREIHAACSDFTFPFGFKFQYRHLDTFIHPDYQGRSDIKYVKRFSETRLSADDFKALKAELDRLGFLSICTPFDEASVDLLEAQGIDVVKIASCSFTDWPLLERIARCDKPVIASTAGAALADIDKVVSFFEHRQKPLVLMHCVGEYPTVKAHFQLNQIRFLQMRYPQVRIGYSTHEAPECTDAVKMAIAAGATVFEKHVGVPTADMALNEYSAAPAQIRTWLTAAREAFEMCGVSGARHAFSDSELASLRALRRGVFARRLIRAGERIHPEDIFLAIPVQAGQLTANDLSKYTEYYAARDLAPKAAVLSDQVKRAEMREKVYAAVQRIKALLESSHVVIPGKADLEISHHYGLERFEEFGITMITIVNREYCKKLIIILPGQKHPEQYHKSKEETFHILWGDVSMTLDDAPKECRQGDVVVIEAGVKHAFSSRSGAVIEEISSTHYKEDSFYTDPAITANKDRKTCLTYWMG